MRCRTLLLSTALVLAITAQPGSARAPKRAPPELYHSIFQAQLACSRADDAVFAGMNQIATRFGAYCRAQGRFPTDFVELNALRNRLLPLLGNNPYLQEQILANQIAAQGSQFSTSAADVSVGFDLGLCPSKIAQLEHEPPDNWRAYPGSISILHNTEDLLLVWGAGIDGKPIKDPTSNILRMVAIRVHR